MGNDKTYYRLILDLENRLFLYFDETEFRTFEEAVSVAKYIALNGYPFGETCLKVKKVKIVMESEQVTILGKDYENEVLN